MIRHFYRCTAYFVVWLLAVPSPAFSPSLQIVFTVQPEPGLQTFHVKMDLAGLSRDSVILKMPVWTPGYYQVLDYADNVSAFQAENEKGQPLQCRKLSKNSWSVYTSSAQHIVVAYDVKATRSFVATNYLDDQRGYIMPAGLFMHPANHLSNPSVVEVMLPDYWKDVATGLTPGKKLHTFGAANFDVLYDSPILMGNLEALPSFEVGGKKHRFVGYKLGEFDRSVFINDLKKIVTVATEITGHIPYNDYTFIAMGPGQGGIEHLNSTSFGFNGDALNSPEGKFRLYSFLAHEYFHHYNVKRIRPIELGPFDYDRENRTYMLWVSEGLTVYYDLMIVRWAGLCTVDQLFDAFQARLSFENKPGKLYQSATDASYNTWSDGPFGRTDEEAYKTISVYDKGAILGLLLDFKIRHESSNKRSLNDVMRFLYNEYYLRAGRGFTEVEFINACEREAGVTLMEFFQYTYNTAPIDYKRYLGYAGLDIDMQPRKLPGGWLGIRARKRGENLTVFSVEYNSPAWVAGVRGETTILEMNGKSVASLDPIMSDLKAGVSIFLKTEEESEIKTRTVIIGTKVEPTLKITRMKNQNALQKQIFESWVGVLPSN